MEKLDIILWLIGGGFALMLVMWGSINGRMDRLEKRIDQAKDEMGKRIDQSKDEMGRRIDQSKDELGRRIDGVEKRIDKMDEKLTDIDRRLCRLEGAFASKDCCVIKESNQNRKAE